MTYKWPVGTKLLVANHVFYSLIDATDIVVAEQESGVRVNHETHITISFTDEDGVRCEQYVYPVEHFIPEVDYNKQSYRWPVGTKLNNTNLKYYGTATHILTGASNITVVEYSTGEFDPKTHIAVSFEDRDGFFWDALTFPIQYFDVEPEFVDPVPVEEGPSILLGERESVFEWGEVVVNGWTHCHEHYCVTNIGRLFRLKGTGWVQLAGPVG